MRKGSFIIFALLALSGFTIGLALGIHGPDEEEPSPPAARPAQAPPSRQPAPARPVVPPDPQDQLAGLLIQARSAGAGSPAAAELQRTVDRWLLADPMACIAWLHDRGASGLVSLDLLQDVFVTAFRGDLVQAIRAGAEISDPVLRSAWLRSIFEVAKQSEPERALELVNSLPPQMQNDVAREIISAWAASDGPAAWNAVVAGKRPDSATLASAALHFWAKADSAAVQDFIRQNLPNPGRGKEKGLFRTALHALASSDPSLVVLNSLAGEDRDPGLQYTWMWAVSSAAKSDLDRALQIIDREPPGARRDAARGSLAKAALRSDVNRALEIAATLPSYSSRQEVAAAATEHIIDKASQPEQAAILAQSHEEPLLRADQMAMVTRLWLEKDRAAFVQFALAQPEEAGERWLDALAEIGIFSSVLSSPSPSRISDPVQRARLERELSTRLPPEQVAPMLDRLVVK